MPVIECPACKGLCNLPLNTSAKQAMTMPKIFLESHVCEHYHTCELCLGNGRINASNKEIAALAMGKKMMEQEHRRLREQRRKRSKFR